MLKSKEKRENTLIVVMIVITLAFIISLFFPNKSDHDDKEKENPQQAQDVHTPGKKLTKDKVPAVLDVEKLSAELLTEMDATFTSIFSEATRSHETLFAYDSKHLSRMMQTLTLHPLLSAKSLTSDPIDKAVRLSYLDLPHLLDFIFPEAVGPRLKFNIFLTYFLLRIQEVNRDGQILELSQTKFERYLDVSCFELLGNELEMEYQLLPIVFYYQWILQRSSLFPVNDASLHFLNKVGKIRDLTPSRWLEKIRKYLEFSSETIRYSLEWREDDWLDRDDQRVYRDLNLTTYHFLEQMYLVFPEIEAQEQTNAWMSDLAKSDSGKIELIYLLLTGENPMAESSVQTIWYNPSLSRFMVLLKTFPAKDEDLIDNMAQTRINDVKLYYRQLDLTAPFEENESGLYLFGEYIRTTFHHIP